MAQGWKSEHGNLDRLPGRKPGSLRRPDMDDTKGGAFVVVGVRESRMQGEGKQEDDRIAKTEEWSVDMDHRTDKVWVLGIQSKLYQWSKANPDDQWRDMWGWLTDLRVLRRAWHRVASNKGGRTAGVDGMTVGRIRNRSEVRFLTDLQADLRSGAYSAREFGAIGL